MQPVFRFGIFFQSNVEFCNEIRLAVSVLRFVDNRSDGSAAAKELFGYYGFMLGFRKIGVEPDDPGTEVYGFIDQDIGFHNITLRYYN